MKTPEELEALLTKIAGRPPDMLVVNYNLTNNVNYDPYTKSYDHKKNPIMVEWTARFAMPCDDEEGQKLVHLLAAEYADMRISSGEKFVSGAQIITVIRGRLFNDG